MVLRDSACGFSASSASHVVQWLTCCFDVWTCNGCVSDDCYFSYHGLINLKYENHGTKTASVNRLAREKNISVREAERWLDTEAYLKEQLQWTSSGLHQKYLCQMMFHHAAVTSKIEHNCAICQGRWEPSAEWDMEAEHQPTTMELIQPDSSREYITEIYCYV